MTIQDMRDRWYYFHRMALCAGLSQGGIHRNSKRTQQLWRIERKARFLLDRARAQQDLEFMRYYE